jgi:hypothetical protein
LAGPVGAPNRWITLRALRVLDWYARRDQTSDERAEGLTRRCSEPRAAPGSTLPAFVTHPLAASHVERARGRPSCVSLEQCVGAQNRRN